MALWSEAEASFERRVLRVRRDQGRPETGAIGAADLDRRQRCSGPSPSRPVRRRDGIRCVRCGAWPAGCRGSTRPWRAEGRTRADLVVAPRILVDDVPDRAAVEAWAEAGADHLIVGTSSFELDEIRAGLAHIASLVEA